MWPFTRRKKKSLGGFRIDCLLNKYFSFQLAYVNFGQKYIIPYTFFRNQLSSAIVKLLCFEPLYSGHLSIGDILSENQWFQLSRGVTVFVLYLRDDVHTHFVTLIVKWTIVGGWVRHRADKRGKVAKLKYTSFVMSLERDMKRYEA